ncbi:hypothetical protein ACQR3P_29190 [Rhodococcus sp. IEGM1300]
MLELLDKVSLNPIARLAIEDFLTDVPDGSRVSRTSYEKWRNTKQDPFLPSYHLIETNHPEVPRLFDDLSDELLKTRRQSSLEELIVSVRLFHTMTGSKRIKGYNEWRKDRLRNHSEDHPAPNLDLRGMKWADVLKAAGFDGCDPLRTANIAHHELSVALFLEQADSFTSYAYGQWYALERVNPTLSGFKPSSTTALVKHMGPTWKDVLSHMGADEPTIRSLAHTGRHFRYDMADGSLVRDEFGHLLFELV